MPTFNTTATLDGVNPFTIDQFGTFSWGGVPGFIRTLNLFDADTANIHNIDLSFSGSWSLREPLFHGGAVFNVALSDSDANVDRFGAHLRFHSTGSLTIDFQTTNIRLMNLRDGEFDLNLGAGFTEAIEIRQAQSVSFSNTGQGVVRSLDIGGNDTLHIESNLLIGGRANQVRIFRGENDIDVTGRIDSLFSDHALSNAIDIAAGGRIDYARLNGVYNESTGTFSQRSDNDIDAQGQIDFLHLWAGENSVEVGAAGVIRSLVLEESLTTLVVANGGRVDHLRAWEGENTITLQGSARVLSMQLENGQQTVTTDSNCVDFHPEVTRVGV